MDCSPLMRITSPGGGTVSTLALAYGGVNVNGFIIVLMLFTLLLKESHMSEVGLKGHRDNKLQSIWTCLMLANYEFQTVGVRKAAHISFVSKDMELALTN